MRCRACRHEERAAIEAACARRETADVAASYGLSERALERHLAEHGPASSVRVRADVHEEAPATLRSAGVAA